MGVNDDAKCCSYNLESVIMEMIKSEHHREYMSIWSETSAQYKVFVVAIYNYKGVILVL